jgi:hypothetical protein
MAVGKFYIMNRVAEKRVWQFIRLCTCDFDEKAEDIRRGGDDRITLQRQ